MQRAFDIVFSSIAIILLSPLLIPICIILKSSGEGEIFYRQKRIGKNEIPFEVIKFATMLKNSPSIGAGDITVQNDPRVLPIGRILRKTKVNELPQLLNILLGHMSIVGPRPMVPNTYKKYGSAGKKVYSIRPGLTGIGSVVFRDEEKHLENKKNSMDFYSLVIIPYKTKIELWYLDNASLLTYFQVMLLTAWGIICPTSKLYTVVFNNLPKPPEELTSNRPSPST